MKLQTIALGLAFAVAGSAALAATETTVVRNTPHGTVTKHIVRTNDRQDFHHDYRHVKKVVVVHPEHRHYNKVVVMHPQHHHYKKVVVMHPQYRPAKKVVIVHPAHYGHYAQNRTVVIHRSNG